MFQQFSSMDSSQMNPFQELKLLYSHVFRGLRVVKWRGVISGTVVGYIGALVVLLLAFRLLDGVWDWRTNMIRAAVVAGLVGLNLALQGAMRHASITIQEDLLLKQLESKESEVKQ